MTIIGNPRSFYKKFKFRVEVDGFDNKRAAFQKCSALEAEVAKVEYFEGGALIPNKSPGRVTFPDVTLERGACKDEDLYRWFRQVVDVTTGPDLIGKKDSQYKRGVEIVQQDRDNTTLRRWSLANAWPTKFTAGDWDNTSDEVVIESLVVAYDFFKKV